MSKVRFFIQESWLLIVSSFVFGLLLAVSNAALSPRIEQNKLAGINQLMVTLLPQAAKFEPAAKTDIDLGRGKKAESRIFKAISSTGECVGWLFNAEGAGFADKIEMIIAVDKNFEKIAGLGFSVINETPGFGDRAKQPYYRNQFMQAPVGDLKLVKTGDAQKIDAEIVAITGATVTSRAVVAILNDYLRQVEAGLSDKGLLQK